MKESRNAVDNQLEATLCGAVGTWYLPFRWELLPREKKKTDESLESFGVPTPYLWTNKMMSISFYS